MRPIAVASKDAKEASASRMGYTVDKRTKFEKNFVRRRDVFENVCLIDALRAHGYKLQYMGDGPFYARADGNLLLGPWKRFGSINV